MSIEDQIIDLARRLRALRGVDGNDAASEREAIKEALRTIGLTAAFFGGVDGMTKLHDAVEAMAGETNEIGDVLNRTWDGIGGWWA